MDQFACAARNRAETAPGAHSDGSKAKRGDLGGWSSNAPARPMNRPRGADPVPGSDEAQETRWAWDVVRAGIVAAFGRWGGTGARARSTCVFGRAGSDLSERAH